MRFNVRDEDSIAAAIGKSNVVVNLLGILWSFFLDHFLSTYSRGVILRTRL